MPKYRKKPVVIEAIQYDGANVNEIIEFTKGQAMKNGGKSDYMTIPTLEGDHIALTGDFIICGVKGEFYPCKPDIFAETYEKINNEKAKKELGLKENSNINVNVNVTDCSRCVCAD